MMPDDTTLPAGILEKSPPGSFIDACHDAPDHLLYFLLNVGDGDTQVIVLPAEHTGRGSGGEQPVLPGERSRTARRMIIIDVATTRKLPALISALADAEIVPDIDNPGLFPVVVATHPHDDHLGGMPEFIRRFGDQVVDFWDPGFYHTSGAYTETMVALEANKRIDRMQPTSGTVRFIGAVKLTILTPGVGLKSRFDTYGVNVNDASISLKMSYPAARIAQMPIRGHEQPGAPQDRRYLRLAEPWSLLLGGDAQTTAWAQATLDFPELKQEDSLLARELRAARGSDELQAQIVKMPHHASKHGVNLELIERIKPWAVLVSSVGGGGKYNFPHRLAVEAAREGIQPSTTRSARRRPDNELGIHYTGGMEDLGSGKRRPLGSIAIMVPPRRGAKPTMWRFMDATRDDIVLKDARRMPYLRKTRT
jgi:beta-lactamase superfamily II metal-dependent hydrolase